MWNSWIPEWQFNMNVRITFPNIESNEYIRRQNEMRIRCIFCIHGPTWIKQINLVQKQINFCLYFWLLDDAKLIFCLLQLEHIANIKSAAWRETNSNEFTGGNLYWFPSFQGGSGDQNLALKNDQMSVLIVGGRRSFEENELLYQSVCNYK